MRILLPLLMLVVAMDAAAATPVGGWSRKGSRPGVARPAMAAEVAAAARVGGDTFGDALFIVATPFTDTGTTVGYSDDYTEFCGISMDAAPDVVYAFVPQASGWFRFDLCGSAYDTKLVVYDEGQTMLACNDDFDIQADEGSPCYLNARIADFFCEAGVTYYLVVDGYDTSAGDYTLTVSSWTHCDVAPPADAVAEGEPALQSGQEDMFNCGCGCAAEPVFTAVSGDIAGAAVVALRHGWRDVGFRDFDHFRGTAGATGSINVEYESEVESIVRLNGSTSCEDPGQQDWAHVVPCGSAVLNAVVTPGTEFSISIEPVQYASPWGTIPVEYDAVLRITGLNGGVPTEGTAWGSLKGMYR